jgi:hypothetical protein
MRILSAFSLALAVFAAAAGPDRSHLRPVTLDELKFVYLECNRRAARTVIDPAEAAHCSLVQEELLQRGFRGSHRDLLAWWRARQPPFIP